MGSGAILGLRVKVQVRNARAPEDLVVDLIGKDLAQYATKSRNRRTSGERNDMCESWSDSGSLLVLIITPISETPSHVVVPCLDPSRELLETNALRGSFMHRCLLRNPEP